MVFSRLICVLMLVVVCESYDNNGCPAHPCICESGDDGPIINCRQLYLTKPPRIEPTGVKFKQLSLRKNNIRSLDAYAFVNLDVTYIDLSENIVTDIHEKAFAGLENSLEKLDIQVYSMTGLPIKALKGLKKLKVLRVSGCDVSTLINDSFIDFVSLRELHLTSCRIKRIEQFAFNTLEAQLNVLTLKDNKLSDIPIESITKLQSLHKLVLSSNEITTVPRDIFKDISRLQHLDLASNKIDTIESGAFTGLEKTLEFLAVQENNLDASDLKPISILRNLKQLEAANNKISELPAEIFKHLVSLSLISLQSNKIRKIDIASFKGTSEELQVLLLSENPISSLEDGTFRGFRRMKHLYMDATKIGRKLTSKTFKGLEGKLETLSLRGVGLNNNGLVAIKNLRHIRTLKLTNNDITEIRDFTFGKMNKLRRLDLSGNRIKFISDKTFGGLEMSLRQIILKGNLIQSLPACTFEGFKYLGDIVLSLNPLQCDCRMRWLQKWITERVLDFRRQLLDWKCNGPPEHANKLFRSLLPYELACKDNSTTSFCENTMKIASVASAKKISFQEIDTSDRASAVPETTQRPTSMATYNKGSTTEVVQTTHDIPTRGDWLTLKIPSSALDARTIAVSVGSTWSSDISTQERGIRFESATSSMKPKMVTVNPVSEMSTPTLATNDKTSTFTSKNVSELPLSSIFIHDTTSQSSIVYPSSYTTSEHSESVLPTAIPEQSPLSSLSTQSSISSVSTTLSTHSFIISASSVLSTQSSHSPTLPTHSTMAPIPSALSTQSSTSPESTTLSKLSSTSSASTTLPTERTSPMSVDLSLSSFVETMPNEYPRLEINTVSPTIVSSENKHALLSRQSFTLLNNSQISKQEHVSVTTIYNLSSPTQNNLSYPSSMTWARADSSKASFSLNATGVSKPTSYSPTHSALPKQSSHLRLRMTQAKLIADIDHHNFLSTSKYLLEETVSLNLTPNALSDNMNVRPTPASPLLPSDFLKTGIYMEILADTPSSVVVTWNVTSSTIIAGFQVHYREANASSLLDSQTLPGGTRAYSIDNLKPSVDYVFCVSAIGDDNNVRNRECREIFIQNTADILSDVPGEEAQAMALIIGAYAGGAFCITCLLLVSILAIRHFRYKKEDQFYSPGPSAWCETLYSVPYHPNQYPGFLNTSISTILSSTNDMVENEAVDHSIDYDGANSEFYGPGNTFRNALPVQQFWSTSDLQTRLQGY